MFTEPASFQELSLVKASLQKYPPVPHHKEKTLGMLALIKDVFISCLFITVPCLSRYRYFQANGTIFKKTPQNIINNIKL